MVHGHSAICRLDDKAHIAQQLTGAIVYFSDVTDPDGLTEALDTLGPWPPHQRLRLLPRRLWRRH